MRRWLSAALAVLIVAAAAVASGAGGTSSGSQQNPSAKFDVIFDDARGLVGGQLIKVAGARAGEIDNVVVTPDFKAKIEATIDARFMPFHQDATCTIRPEGLIAENYVDCDPGTLGSPPLRSERGQPPTVPVSHTTEPVSLLDLFNIFNLPTRERFTAIVNELGIGTAGRGDDFNAILLRANPTLAEARQLISILAAQKQELAGAVDATNSIAAEGAAHPAAIQGFLNQAASLATTTAAHRDALSRSVARLPALLAAAQPSLADLDTVARDGTPLVAQLHAAVPSLNRVAADLGPFSAAAQPALSDMRTALREAIPAVRETTPLVRTVAAYVHRSLPGTQLFARLAANLQRHGFAENFLSIFYYISASLARFDTTSHMLSILLVGPQNGQCGNYATKPTPGCSAHFGQQPAYTPQSAGVAGDNYPSPALVPTPPAAAATPSASARPGAAGRPRNGSSHVRARSGPALTPTAGGGGATSSAAGTLQNLVGYLLR